MARMEPDSKSVRMSVFHRSTCGTKIVNMLLQSPLQEISFNHLVRAN